MALNIDIFETDPDAKPERHEEYSDGTVGRFHSGHTVLNEKGKAVPEPLDEWKFTTADRGIADAVAQLFGGQVTVDEHDTAEFNVSVYTEATKIPVILGADAIDADFKKFDNNKLTHHCTGSKFLSHPSRDELVGKDCGCPPLLADKLQNADDLIGPKPSITIMFRLADDPELGLFKFVTGSRTMLKVLHEYAADLGETDGDSVADLSLELVSYIGKRGPMKGKRVEYTKPVLDRIRSYNAAIAE